MRTSELPAGRVVVISPHLDDAVLSLGAGIARAVRAGTDVRVITVFANDPESDDSTTTAWDRDAGFASASEAARRRRNEDARACEIVGARPVWLPFMDEDHGGEGDRERVREMIAEASTGADVLLLPGYPLAHPDHGRVTRWMLAAPPSTARLGFYVEQPYAAWRHLGRGRRVWAAPGLTPARGLRNLGSILLRTRRGRLLQAPSLADNVVATIGSEPVWSALPATMRDRVVKQRGIWSYESQLGGFGKHTGVVIGLYELGWGGEGIAWLESQDRR